MQTVCGKALTINDQHFLRETHMRLLDILTIIDRRYPARVGEGAQVLHNLIMSFKGDHFQWAGSSSTSYSHIPGLKGYPWESGSTT
jgi:hypothetical protein